jgi:putative ABC transport system ATP-binding protein
VLNGKDVSNMVDNELAAVRNSEIGFVFQQFNLLPRLSAWENVAVPLIYAGVSRREREQRAREMLNKVGLAERAHHKPNELSGGQSQRVAIARALINNPAIILADEPTGNLDSHTGEEIIELLCALRSERNATLLIATHDAKVAARAPKVLELADGRILE